MIKIKPLFIILLSGFFLAFLPDGWAGTLTFEERFAKDAKRMESEFNNFEQDGIKCIDFTVKGKEITIKFVTLDHSSKHLDPIKFSKTLNKYTLEYTCQDENIEYLLKNDVVFKYQYFSNDDILINETAMDKIFCGYE